MSTTPLPTVYLEASVISYLTSPPSRDLIRAARQQVTRRLWKSIEMPIISLRRGLSKRKPLPATRTRRPSAWKSFPRQNC